MTPNTAAMSDARSFSWNRSDMLLTNTRDGRRQRNGSDSLSGISATWPVQRLVEYRTVASPGYAKPAYGWPGCAHRAACRSA